MRLTKNERAVLATYSPKTKELSRPEGLTDQQLSAALFSLEEKNILTARHPLPDKWDIRITDHGRIFLEGNPMLKNDISWEIAMRWVAIATLGVAITALFVGILRLLQM